MAVAPTSHNWLHTSVESRTGRVSVCSWTTHKIEGQRITDTLRAARDHPRFFFLCCLLSAPRHNEDHNTWLTGWSGLIWIMPNRCKTGRARALRSRRTGCWEKFASGDTKRQTNRIFFWDGTYRGWRVPVGSVCGEKLNWIHTGDHISTSRAGSAIIELRNSRGSSEEFPLSRLCHSKFRGVGSITESSRQGIIKIFSSISQLIISPLTKSNNWPNVRDLFQTWLMSGTGTQVIQMTCQSIII